MRAARLHRLSPRDLCSDEGRIPRRRGGSGRNATTGAGTVQASLDALLLAETWTRNVAGKESWVPKATETPERLEALRDTATRELVSCRF